MTIENSLERIADALERLAKDQEVANHFSPPVEVQPEAPKKAKKAVRPTDSILDEPVPDPIADEEPEITTPDQLRLLAQKIAEKMGDKSPRLVEFVRKEVCAKFNVDRLIKIEEKNVPLAATYLNMFAKKEGINV